jgi:hypothetical protein
VIFFLCWLCVLARLANVEAVAGFDSAGRVQHAAQVGEDVVVVTHAAADRVVTRAGAVVARVRPGRAGVDYLPRGSDDLIVSGSGWWYASLDGVEDRPATTFVKSDGSRVTHASPASGPVRSYLIALAGDEPRALDFSSTLESTLVRELDWSGVVRSWQLPREYELWPHMTAERLPDGRIALFSSRAGLTMYVLSDDGAVDTRVLSNLHFSQFATAIDDAGRIAVVVANNQSGTIEASIVDADADRDPEWLVLRRDASVMGRLREMRIVRGADGFIAMWINEGSQRRIEAVNLRANSEVVTIGNASPRGNTAFFDVQAFGEELIVFWDDGEHLFRRRVPASLPALAVIDAAKRVCAPEGR